MYVRRLRTGEQEDVVELWHETRKHTYTFIALEEGLGIEESRAYFANRIAPNCDLWVAEENGRLLGYLAIRGSYVDRVYVRPREQRRGVGTALLEKARELSPTGLELHTHQQNWKARRFYEKHGFEAVAFGVSPPPESEPDVEYRWRPPR